MSTPVPVVAIVTFPARTDLDGPALRELLLRAGPEYTNVPGLRRKYFLGADGVAGGVYEWDCRERALAFHSAQWFDRMTAQSGSRPELRLFDSPAIADGILHRLEVYVPGEG